MIAIVSRFEFCRPIARGGFGLLHFGVAVCAVIVGGELVGSELVGANTALEAAPPVYEMREDHDPNGIGKFYMGREIAHVMGHQGIPWLERDTREQEERLSKLVKILDLKPGDNVADIGAGSGVITMMMARKIAPSGTVYAVDIQPEMLAAIETKLEKAEIDNVELVLGTIKSPKLPENSCDLAFMVDVYHEFNFPHEMLAGIVAGLKPGGRIAFIEYRKEDPTIRIKEVHKMTEAQVKKEALQAEFGLRHVTTNEELPLQHVVIFEKIGDREEVADPTKDDSPKDAPTKSTPTKNVEK